MTQTFTTSGIDIVTKVDEKEIKHKPQKINGDKLVSYAEKSSRQIRQQQQQHN